MPLLGIKTFSDSGGISNPKLLACPFPLSMGTNAKSEVFHPIGTRPVLFIRLLGALSRIKFKNVGFPDWYWL